MRSEYAAKAFDTLDHEKIINVSDSYGIRCYMSQTKHIYTVFYVMSVICMCASNYVICAT